MPTNKTRIQCSDTGGLWAEQLSSQPHLTFTVFYLGTCLFLHDIMMMKALSFQWDLITSPRLVMAKAALWKFIFKEPEYKAFKVSGTDGGCSGNF